MRTDVVARALGSVTVVLGYFVTLHVNVTIGAVMMTSGDILAIPFFIRTKSWDVVVMVSFLSVVTASKVAQGWFTSGS
jgi:hypothetical protein